MASLEIDSRDVIRLMLQFMKENNMTNSMRELQIESDVTLNTVDNLESFTSDIQKGHWDSVLSQVSSLKLPREKLVRYHSFHLILHCTLCNDFDRRGPESSGLQLSHNCLLMYCTFPDGSLRACNTGIARDI